MLLLVTQVAGVFSFLWPLLEMQQYYSGKESFTWTKFWATFTPWGWIDIYQSSGWCNNNNNNKMKLWGSLFQLQVKNWNCQSTQLKIFFLKVDSELSTIKHALMLTIKIPSLFYATQLLHKDTNRCKMTTNKHKMTPHTSSCHPRKTSWNENTVTRKPVKWKIYTSYLWNINTIDVLPPTCSFD